MSDATLFIPYGTQWIDEDDISAVVEVLRSGFLTQGPNVAAFEKAIAQYVGAKYCVAFCNGTAALQCAVKVLNISEGFEGITSANTFVASANCLAYNALKPVFADIDARTFNVTANSIRVRISPKTKVLIPVHFAGQACDMPAIAVLAREKDVPVIEDACHAIGSKYADGSMVGNCRYSRMTVFSFHPVKAITTGEGGAITTNDTMIYRKLVMLRSHGITKDPDLLSQNPGPWYYEQQELGYNFRITDMQCALGLRQLVKLDIFKVRRKEIITAYNNAFSGLANVQVPYEAEGLDSCFHLYVLQIDFSAMDLDRALVMKSLAEKGIGTQVLYIPVHTQPWYKKTYSYKQGDYPVAEAYYQKALSIPLYPKMSNEDVGRVIESIKGTLRI
jgi:UDP-4-amino-4,6-dideoxy-N-acetyl-beta-L-altrosamine transaminase